MKTAEAENQNEIRPDHQVTNIFLLKKAVVTFFFFLVALSIAEVLARILVVNAKPLLTSAQELDRKYQLARTPFDTPGKKIIFLGDSLMDFAVYPELLSANLRAERTQVTIKNLATPGNTFELSLFLLKKAIASGNRPDVLIYNIHPRLFNQNFLYQNAITRFQNSLISQCEPLNDSAIHSFKCFLAKHMYLIGYRKYFKQEMTNLPITLLSPRSRLNIESPGYVLTEVSANGWAPGYHVYTKQEFQEKFSGKYYFNKISSELSNYRWSARNFKKFRAYCRTQSIPLIMLWLPENPVAEQYYQHYHLSGEFFENHFNRLFKKQEITFINLHNAISDSTAYYDPDHLNVKGAVMLSSLLTQELNKVKAINRPTVLTSN